MDIKTNVLIGYFVLGLLMLIFNQSINKLYYKFVMFYTDKLSINQLFLFKVNHKNKGTILKLTRVFTIAFSSFILLFSAYYLLS